jgi:TolB-like protein
LQVKNFYEQLKQRRVIRAAVIYAALFWALLQVADLLAGASIIGDASVRWIILAGVVGFPLTLIGSWFLESPWRQRRWSAIAGDLLIIVAICTAAFLFAWQQWFKSFTRPVVAVLPIEATDTRDDTADLADHLTKRIRMLLATRAELKVIETNSSNDIAIEGMSLTQKASLLNAEILIGGTLSRGGDDIRLSIQVYDRSGELMWSDRFEDRLVDQAQLQNRLLTELWPHLPTNADAITAAHAIVSDCDYPTDRAAILALAKYARQGGDAEYLSRFVNESEDNGLFYLEQARGRFSSIPSLAAVVRPVAQNLAMQSLEQAEAKCPNHPDIDLLRLENTLTFRQKGVAAAKHVAEHPNAASLYVQLAEIYAESGDDETSLALFDEAVDLDPASSEKLCRYRALLQSLKIKNSNAAAEVQRVEELISVYVPLGCDGQGIHQPSSGS